MLVLEYVLLRQFHLLRSIILFEVYLKTPTFLYCSHFLFVSA